MGMDSWRDFQPSQTALEQQLGRPLTWVEKLGLWWDDAVNANGVVGGIATGADYYAQFANDTLGFTPLSDAALGVYEVAAPAVVAAWNWKRWIIGGALVLGVIYLLGRLR